MSDRRHGPPGGRRGSAGPGRGVSEVVGFILVFSLVVSVVGIISVAGLETLQSARNAEQVNNAERAMEVVADNMADIHERGAPSRATEISLEDAQMYMDESVEVKVEGDVGTLSTFSETFTLRPLVYDGVEDVQLVYVMGAIFRVQSGGSVVLREWSPATDDNYVSLPIVRTTSSTGGSQSIQSETVLVRAEGKEPEIVRANTTDEINDVTVRVETPRADVWERMLSSSQSFDSCTTGTGPEFVKCDLTREPRTFFIVETRISVTIKQ